MVTVLGAQESFSEKLMTLLDSVEYRRVETSEDMEDIARLRYRAYKMAGIMPVYGGALIDQVDFDSHAYVFGIYFEERLISTVRIHHVTPDHRVSSSMKVFPEPITQFLDAGMTLIDPVRFAADPEIMREMPAIPYYSLRIVTMAAEYFRANRILQLVSPQHSAFYRRVCNAETIVETQENCGGYQIPLTLLASKVDENRNWFYERYPSFRSETFERRMMFDRRSNGGIAPLTIRPTARFAATTRRFDRYAQEQQSLSS